MSKPVRLAPPESYIRPAEEVFNVRRVRVPALVLPPGEFTIEEAGARIIMRWSATDELPDGSPYRNRGVHIIKMKWGKVTAIDAHEDSQAVAESLHKQSAMGITEAAASPITS